MRAGRATFLFGLALIHVSLAGKPIKQEEEPTELEDGEVIIDGYVFNGDEIFTEKANSILQYSAEVMKNSTTDEGRHYTFCNRVGYNIVCLDVIVTNSTNLQQDFAKAIQFESSEVIKAGYIFDGDEIFAEKMGSLLNYTYQVLKDCHSRHCRYYTYCTKVGYDIVCLTVQIGKNEDYENEDITEISAVSVPHFKSGNIFDGDKIFARQSTFFLNYSRRVMRLSPTKIGRSYTVCYKVDDDITCLTVWLSRGEREFINDLYGIHDFGTKPYGAQHDFLGMKREDYPQFPQGSDIDDDQFLTPSKEDFEEEENTMEDFEEEENTMEDLPEEENTMEDLAEDN